MGRGLFAWHWHRPFICWLRERSEGNSSATNCWTFVVLPLKGSLTWKPVPQTCLMMGDLCCTKVTIRVCLIQHALAGTSPQKTLWRWLTCATEVSLDGSQYPHNKTPLSLLQLIASCQWLERPAALIDEEINYHWQSGHRPEERRWATAPISVQLTWSFKEGDTRHIQNICFCLNFWLSFLKSLRLLSSVRFSKTVKMLMIGTEPWAYFSGCGYFDKQSKRVKTHQFSGHWFSSLQVYTVSPERGKVKEHPVLLWTKRKVFFVVFVLFFLIKLIYINFIANTVLQRKTSC